MCSLNVIANIAGAKSPGDQGSGYGRKETETEGQARQGREAARGGVGPHQQGVGRPEGGGGQGGL